MATRATLRRLLGERTGQPFFRRFGGGAGTTSTSGSTTTLIDTAKLKEEDDYWNGSFVYLPSTGEQREVSDFANSTSTLTWLAAVASSVGSGVSYELWGTFTPREVHAALDYALAVAWPYFFQITEDETLVVEENAGLVYTLPSTNAIRRLCQVYLKIYDSEKGETTAGSTTTRIYDTGAFDDAEVGEWIAFYKDADDAQGQVRQITAVDASGNYVDVGVAFSGAPPTGASYRRINKNYAYINQTLLQNWVADKQEFPTQIWFGEHLTGYEGFPLTLVYEYEFPSLSAEATDTACPQEYLINAALAYLYFQKLATSPASQVPNWEALHRAAVEATKRYVDAHKFRHLPSTFIRHELSMGSIPADWPFR